MIAQLALQLEEPRRLPSPRDKYEQRLADPENEAALLAVYQSRPGEWLDDFVDLRDVLRDRSIGSCYGHILARLARKGLLESRDIYFGSDHPAKPDYRGFHTDFRFKGEQS